LEHHRDVALGRLQRVDHARADGDVAAADVFRNNVDLPQPEGPTMTMNSWSAISALTPWITCSSVLPVR
jgi:hypothetical protein